MNECSWENSHRSGITAKELKRSHVSSRKIMIRDQATRQRVPGTDVGADDDEMTSLLIKTSGFMYLNDLIIKLCSI